MIESTKDPAVAAEADVIVNSALRYDSYRGPQQSGAGGDVFDLHRVLLHEFGHVLGLDHTYISTPPRSLMEPYISDVDHLSLDDVGRIRNLYGVIITFLPGETSIREGDSWGFPYIEANNSPSSFSAVGLPPGMTMDTATGSISGTVTTPGKYAPVITAHGPIVDAYASFIFSMVGIDQVPGLISIVRHLDVTGFLADPQRPRIYAASDEGIEMIETETGTVSVIHPSQDAFLAISLSADGTLLYFRASGESILHRLEVDTFTELPSLVIPPGYSAVKEGHDHRGYSKGADGISQFDLSTGALQWNFGSTSPSVIELTPDQNTLVVTSDEGTISTYDVSTDTPVLITTKAGYKGAVASVDSRQLFCQALTSLDAPMAALPLPAMSPTRAFGSTGGYLLAVAPEGQIYQSGFSYINSVLIVDPDSLKQSDELYVDHRPYDQYRGGQVLFDGDSDNFFYPVYHYGTTELWKFSKDFASFPPPDPIPTGNLLNISTRATSGTGTDAMIGGFIIQGDTPKKVVIRGMGPSLPLSGAIVDPLLELYDASGKLLGSNDDWVTDRSDILSSQVPPASEREAAILMTLTPGAYTTVVRDAKGQTGGALVEVYDLAAGDSFLANISTRGKVGSGDNNMIGGFIVGGTCPAQVLVRALGPSLSSQGVEGALLDPVLELHDSEGALVQMNDNWPSTQPAKITATGIAPKNDKESAILATLMAGAYTAIVRGQNDTTGIALVEVYNFTHPSTATK